MVRLQILLSLMTLALWVYCLVEVVTADERRVRGLPKLGWLVVVILLPLIGSILWLAVGRPTGPAPRTSEVGEAFPEYDRPGRAEAQDPAKEAEFLAQVRSRAEQQRQQYDAARRAERLAEERQREVRRAERADGAEGNGADG